MRTPEFVSANSTIYLTLSDTWNQANTYYFVGTFGADEGSWDTPLALGTPPSNRPSSTGDSDFGEAQGSHYSFQVGTSDVYSVSATNWTTMENDRGVRGKQMHVTDQNMVWERCVQPSYDANWNNLENQDFGCLVELPAATDINVSIEDNRDNGGSNSGATFALNVTSGDTVTPSVTPVDYAAFIADITVNDPPTFTEQGRINEGERWARLADTSTDTAGELTVMMFTPWDMWPISYTLYTSATDMLSQSNGKWCEGMCSYDGLTGSVYITYGPGWSQDYALIVVGGSFQVGVTSPVVLPLDGTDFITTVANPDEFGTDRPSWYSVTMAANTTYQMTTNGDASLELWDGARTSMQQYLGTCSMGCTLDNSAVGSPTTIQLRAVPAYGGGGAVHRFTITTLP
jgi:hypothetical protein